MPGFRTPRQLVAWPLPAQSQSFDGQADAFLRDRDPLPLLQVFPQPRRRPDRGVVAPGAGIGVDDLSDQRIDDSQGRGRTTRAGGIGQTRVEIESLTFLKAPYPIMDRLAADRKRFGDLIRRLAL